MRTLAERANPMAELARALGVAWHAIPIEPAFRAFLDSRDDIWFKATCPDRLDALVWAIHDLMLRRQREPRVRVI